MGLVRYGFCPTPPPHPPPPHTHTHTVLTPADDENHIDKHQFKVPFVCGARNLGEALRRIAEGAAMIRTKGEAGTGEGEREREGRHIPFVLSAIFITVASHWVISTCTRWSVSGDEIKLLTTVNRIHCLYCIDSTSHGTNLISRCLRQGELRNEATLLIIPPPPLSPPPPFLLR